MLENISNEMIQKVFFLQISQNIFIHQWYFVYSLNEKKKGVVFPFDKSSNQFEQSVSQSSSNKGRKIDQINISMIPRILNPQLSRVLYSPPPLIQRFLTLETLQITCAIFHRETSPRCA